MDIKALEEKFASYPVEMRRHFHAHPEPSMKEFETSKRIREELTKHGIEWRVCGKSKLGTLASVRGGRPGSKTFLSRADIDELSVTEKTGLPFASRNPGFMHACGHDCHIAMGLTAARILNEIRDEIPGTVKIIFQPAEETAQGALDMIADGALDGVDAMFGMHVTSELPAGKISLEAGARMAAADQFRIEITGRSGHAALPQKCADATPAMAATILSLQTIVSRNCNPIRPLVVTVGQAASGTRWNVISGCAVIEGTVRSFDEDSRGMAEAAMKRIARQTAAAFGCTAAVKYDRLVDIVINNPEIAAIGRGAARKILGEGCAVSSDPTMGGEDFGFYCSHVPAAFAHIGVRNEACGACYPQHSDHYTADESALIKGALLHVQTALDFLEKNP